jgi:hypothetical protein
MSDSSVLRVTGRRVEIDADLARTLVERGIGTLRVDADQVIVCGEFVLPGGVVHIRCRELAGEAATIDVGGRTPTPPWEGARAPDGTAQTVDGQPGQGGAPGMNGGSIGIVCQRVASAPRLLACGSPGGDSQSGGNGARPAPPAAAHNGAFNKAKDGGPYGGRVLKKFGLSYFLSVAYGQAGRNGGRGGDGGPPGKPGRGGDGGDIDMAFCESVATSVVARADPGAAGACGVPGNGAMGAPGGLGGLHRLYRYEWFKETISPLLNSRAAEVLAARRAYKLGERAASGQPGPDGRASDVTYSAPAGKSGAVCCRQVGTSEMAAAVDADFFRQMDRWARQALDCDAPNSAEDAVRWALSLLDAGGMPEEAPVLRESFGRLLIHAASAASVAKRLSGQ